MIKLVDGKEVTLTKKEEDGVLAEQASYVPDVWHKVERHIGEGDDEVCTECIYKKNLTPGQKTALETAGYTLTQI